MNILGLLGCQQGQGSATCAQQDQDSGTGAQQGPGAQQGQDSGTGAQQGPSSQQDQDSGTGQCRAFNFADYQDPSLSQEDLDAAIAAVKDQSEDAKARRLR